MMEMCWEYFDCKEHGCPSRTVNKQCWEIKNTHCQQFKLMIGHATKQELCDVCIYKKQQAIYNGRQKQESKRSQRNIRNTPILF